MQKHVAFLIFVVFASALVVSSVCQVWIAFLGLVISLALCIFLFFFKRRNACVMTLFAVLFFSACTLGASVRKSQETVLEKMPWYCAVDFTATVTEVSAPVFSKDTVINISLKDISSPQIENLPSWYTLNRWVDEKEDIKVGDVLKGRAILVPISAKKNPLSADFAASAHRKNVIGTLYSGHHIPTGKNAINSATLRYHIREHIKNSLLKANVSPLSAQMTSALILADKAAIDHTTKEAFRLSGTTHLLVVSGLHVGIIAMLAWWLTFFLRRKKVLRMAIVLGILWAYGYLCGFSAPVVRALWMFSILTVAGTGKRAYFSLNALGVAGVSYLIFHPMDIFSAGYQMSYAATAGIIVFYPLVDKWCNKIPSPWSFFVKIVAVSMVAQIALLPFVMYYFDYLNLLFPLSNLMLIPLISYIIIPWGLVMIVVALCGVSVPIISTWYSNVCAFAADIASTIGEKSEFAVQGYSLGLFACVAIGLFALAVLFLLRNRKMSLYLALSGVIAVLCSILMEDKSAYVGVVDGKCVVYSGKEFIPLGKNDCLYSEKDTICYATDIRHVFPNERFSLLTDTFFYPEITPSRIILLPSSPVRIMPLWIRYCTEKTIPMYDMRKNGYLKLEE
ncbi:MAG: ComEC/Rec2 family competence protein [Flavobacteriales bacterium]|nr:ComEC/Rec2 family competence protein [Flavobacteriales bacterium]